MQHNTYMQQGYDTGAWESGSSELSKKFQHQFSGSALAPRGQNRGYVFCRHTARACTGNDDRYHEGSQSVSQSRIVIGDHQRSSVSLAGWMVELAAGDRQDLANHSPLVERPLMTSNAPTTTPPPSSTIADGQVALDKRVTHPSVSLNAPPPPSPVSPTPSLLLLDASPTLPTIGDRR